jgi:hypothetical protein
LETALNHYIVTLESQIMEQMMERLLAKVREFHEEMRAEMKSSTGALFSWVDVHQAKTEANHEEWLPAMKASQ